MCPILTCDTALEKSLVRLSENICSIGGLSAGKCTNLEVFYLVNVPMPGDWAELTEFSQELDNPKPCQIKIDYNLHS